MGEDLDTGHIMLNVDLFEKQHPESSVIDCCAKTHLSKNSFLQVYENVGHQTKL
jgi:hypothetical protein